MQIERSKNYLHRLNDDELASAKALLNSYHLLCERKRKEAENLNNELSRLEALVSQFKIKDEGYSNLKQIIKENVKAMLSENKKLISICFAALILTLKADLQMVKLIQNVPSANDGEQYNDNNNNIINYLELNKDRILNLGEKNYERLSKYSQRMLLILLPPLLLRLILHYHCRSHHLHSQTHLIKLI
jgi:hypothetical protein